MKKTVSWLIVFLVVGAMVVSAVPVNGWEYDNFYSRWICMSRTGCYTSSGNDQRDWVLHNYPRTGVRDTFDPSTVGRPPEHIIPQITPQAQTLMQQMNIRVEGTYLVFPDGQKVNFDPSGLSTQTLEVSITAEDKLLKITIENLDESQEEYGGTTAEQILNQVPGYLPTAGSSVGGSSPSGSSTPGYFLGRQMQVEGDWVTVNLQGGQTNGNKYALTPDGQLLVYSPGTQTWDPVERVNEWPYGQQILSSLQAERERRNLPFTPVPIPETEVAAIPAGETVDTATGAPDPHIIFKFLDTGEVRSYLPIDESGTIDGIAYTRKYLDVEHNRVIFVDASGNPIGYSNDEELTPPRLYGRNPLGREGAALREYLILARGSSPATQPPGVPPVQPPPPPHVIRKADGTYETERGYYFYDENKDAYIQQIPALGEQNVVSIQEVARQELGEDLYKRYADRNQIDWSKSEPGSYVLNNEGTIVVSQTTTNPATRVDIVKLDLNDKGQPDTVNSGTYLVRNGQQVAFQSLQQQEEGTITVGGNPFYVGKGSNAINNLASGEVVRYYDAADAKNQLGVIAVQGNSRTITNFREETQTVYNTQTGRTEQREGDYYPKGERSCTDASGCFRPSGGTLFDANGNAISLLNYDYESSGGAGQELGKGGKIPGLKRIERFDPVSGTFDGIEFPDGTIITAQKHTDGEHIGEYSGGYRRTGADGRVTTLTEDSEGRVVVTSDSAVFAAERQFQQATEAVRQAEAAVLAAERRLETAAQPQQAAIREELVRLRGVADGARRRQGDAADHQRQAETQADQIAEESAPAVLDVKSTTRDWQGKLQRGVEAVYAITSQVKSYPALTRLFGLPRVDQDLFEFDADKTFAPMLGSNWFPSAICEAYYDYDLEPEGMATIRTVSGTYQAVANIQMERSETTSPILCVRNPNPEAEEEFICDPGQVCVDNNFCYQDEDADQEPDEDTPLGGYFYKITWGVSAPRDEAFTPFINEDGVAVSFNIWIDTAANDEIDAGAIHMYINTTTRDINGPIKLRNGQSDKDVIIHYSPNVFQEACIGWKQAPSTSNIYAGSSDIGDVCFTVDVSSIGEANFDDAERDAPASTVQGGQVTRNAGW